MTKRQVIESPVYQGADESIAYAFDFSALGTPTSPAVKLETKPDKTDVSSTKLSGSASVTGSTVTTPKVTGLTAGSSYVLTATVTISGNTMSAYTEIRCDNEVV